jgi:glucose/sorbosone dehydrogenase
MSVSIAFAQYPATSQIVKDGTAVMIEDYVELPISTPGPDGPTGDTAGLRYMLGRVNALTTEPADAPQSTTRFFVVDQNGQLYILDKGTKKFTTYLDFSKIFGKFAAAATYGGYSTGFCSITFDPAYTKNGRFYTVHTEQPRYAGSPVPTNAQHPGLNVSGFTVTPVVNPPVGEASYESVLTEWQDTNIRDTTFEGKAREILRAGFNFTFHPMGDVIFNPLAKPGDADYGNLYIGMGDGTAGERPGITHTIPQRLDALQGKILRITPDLALRPQDLLSANGRYRIPSTGSDPNPFIKTNSARPEIYAYGFRNPHRLTWDPISKVLIADDIGAGSWEEVNIVRKGANYGWAEREGHEQLIVGKGTGGRLEPPVPFPSTDTLLVEGIDNPVTPVYASASYSHRDGASIGSGFVYRGKLMPQMVGKYFFSDIVTGRLLYTDLAEMVAAAGVHGKQAQIHELQLVYKSPYETNATPSKRRMFDIVAEAYSHKRTKVPPNNNVLPGNTGLTAGADPDGNKYGGGRADVRLGMGGDGEIYVLSKQDGMIRKLVSVVTPPR